MPMKDDQEAMPGVPAVSTFGVQGAASPRRSLDQSSLPVSSTDSDFTHSHLVAILDAGFLDDEVGQLVDKCKGLDRNRFKRINKFKRKGKPKELLISELVTRPMAESGEVQPAHDFFEWLVSDAQVRPLRAVGRKCTFWIPWRQLLLRFHLNLSLILL
jgi:hypothetical protein